MDMILKYVASLTIFQVADAAQNVEGADMLLA